MTFRSRDDANNLFAQLDNWPLSCHHLLYATFQEHYLLLSLARGVMERTTYRLLPSSAGNETVSELTEAPHVFRKSAIYVRFVGIVPARGAE